MYSSLEQCLVDLEKNGMLIRIKEEVDPYLEMSAIHLRVFEHNGPALLFENVKGSKYRTASNIFGNAERSKFIFRNTFEQVKKLIALKNNPIQALKSPIKNIGLGMSALKALPLKNPISKPVLHSKISIQDLPLIHHWAKDGGAFVTLPLVYSEDMDKPGIMNANLGMYRIQLTGNNYELNKEVGLHYQLHRGIGVHQTKANAKNLPFKVSCFVGGPPAHTVSAVMPLPEGMSEVTFAGVLAARRFRYCYENSFCISTDADFVITGEIYPNQNKPEGPFGDHLGYYSLTHDFPVMQVRNVYARKNAIWPFTVVGRPPQEDTSFGNLIHELTGDAIPNEIPGVKQVHAVDAAGVHPLLLAIGSERYTPYAQTQQPAEILTIANHILGTGQLSLAKYLFITADDSNHLSTYNIEDYFTYILERIVLERDIHFYTNTTIDTLDYSGTELNQGSKVVFAAYGKKQRELSSELQTAFKENKFIKNAQQCMKGIVAIELNKFTDYNEAQKEIEEFCNSLSVTSNTPFIILCDDANFAAKQLNNWIWVCFTRSNPAKDIYGINSFTNFKHWGCKNSFIIDARIKPHHAPVLEILSETKKSIEKIFNKGGSLEGY